MTHAQEEAADKIETLMREHFDAGLVCLEAQDDSESSDIRTYRWHGGLSTCIGLAVLARKRLANQISVEDDE